MYRLPLLPAFSSEKPSPQKKISLKYNNNVTPISLHYYTLHPLLTQFFQRFFRVLSSVCLSSYHLDFKSQIKTGMPKFFSSLITHVFLILCIDLDIARKLSSFSNGQMHYHHSPIPHSQSHTWPHMHRQCRQWWDFPAIYCAIIVCMGMGS